MHCPPMIWLIYSLMPLHHSAKNSLLHKLSQQATLVHTDNILASIDRFPLTKLNTISNTKVALRKKLENLHKSLYSVDRSICRNIFSKQPIIVLEYHFDKFSDNFYSNVILLNSIVGLDYLKPGKRKILTENSERDRTNHFLC